VVRYVNSRRATIVLRAGRRPLAGRHQMLAGSPLGCTEAIMLAHGFTVEILERLVLDGLARKIVFLF
jgi:hypothetical protein